MYTWDRRVRRPEHHPVVQGFENRMIKRSQSCNLCRSKTMTKVALSRSLRYVFISLCNRDRSHWTALWGKITRKFRSRFYVASVFGICWLSKLSTLNVCTCIRPFFLARPFFFLPRILRLSFVTAGESSQFRGSLSPNILAVFQTEKCYYPSPKRR